MAAPFPDHPQLRSNFAPVNFEAQSQDLVIEGALPADLCGSLYRVGPNPKFAPTHGYHWFAGVGNGVSEPVFVPRSPAAAEGEGWLLATVYRDSNRTSELVVLNAQQVDSGPVATARLDHRIPFGFHGSWRG